MLSVLAEQMKQAASRAFLRDIIQIAPAVLAFKGRFLERSQPFDFTGTAECDNAPRTGQSESTGKLSFHDGEPIKPQAALNRAARRDKPSAAVRNFVNLVRQAAGNFRADPKAGAAVRKSG